MSILRLPDEGPSLKTSEMNITGRLPEAGNLKLIITRLLPEKTCAEKTLFPHFQIIIKTNLISLHCVRINPEILLAFRPKKALFTLKKYQLVICIAPHN